jgi:hypothetical protein
VRDTMKNSELDAAIQAKFAAMTPEQKQKFGKIAMKYRLMLEVMSGLDAPAGTTPKLSWKTAFKSMGIKLPGKARHRGRTARSYIAQMMRDELKAEGVI